jgi:hypothetical protein
MAVPKKVLKQVQERDSHCWHCGVEEDLVPHHRKNRGMGGSKLLDTPDNLMMVCAALELGTWSLMLSWLLQRVGGGINYRCGSLWSILFLTVWVAGGIFCLMGVRLSLTGKTRRSE